jgi:DNA-nicking Smr family endonuclease
MTKKRRIGADELSLFRASVEGVTPLAQQHATPYAPPAPPPRLRQREEEAPALNDDMFSDGHPLHSRHPLEELEGIDELLFSRGGLQHNVLRKLRRGQYRSDAELDLHGLRVEEARQALSHFLLGALREKRQCVRIIHGKGHSSQQSQPVLKGKVNHWLRQRDEVLAFCSARPADGGTGALYVLLRRK